MTSVEPGVLDANVFAYAINADAAQHVAARTLVEGARDPSTSLYVTSQILCESVARTAAFAVRVSSSSEGESWWFSKSRPGSAGIRTRSMVMPPLYVQSDS